MCKKCNEAGKQSIQDRVTVRAVKQEEGQNWLLKDWKDFSEYLGKQELETSLSSIGSIDIAPIVEANTLVGIWMYEKKALHLQAH